MEFVTPQFAKSLDTDVDAGYGTIIIRVVVLEKNMASAPSLAESDSTPLDVAADEILPETDKRPISGFLEEPKRGRNVCVFLINGQRQHAWDNQFIVRDLDLKYLRNRMIVIVDCDGLRPEAIADLMQGSRAQFYEGKVYAALESRVLATLKGDPDLRRLEEEAEDDIANLQAGDEAVKSALDQLIDLHHDAALHPDHGHMQPGDLTRDWLPDGTLTQTQTVVAETSMAEAPVDHEPLLRLQPDVATIRLKPHEERRLVIATKPESAWNSLQTLTVTFDPPVKELQVVRTTQLMREGVALTFAEPEEFDRDEYPIETTLRAIAVFSAQPEPRLLERRVVITPGKQGPTIDHQEKPLLDDPTFVRVTSRQPIKITLGGPDLHVKLRWDGKDELVTSPHPEWAFHASCDSPSVEPPFFLTSPVEGRFELLIRSTPALSAGEQLKFDVEAHGPGKTLATAFLADVVDPPSPRKIVAKASGGAQRRPPYDLKYIQRENWTDSSFTCFGEQWSPLDPGSYEEPSLKSPLTIFINKDTDLLTSYRDQLLAKKYAESTIQQRINRYTTHIAFHLYQMFEIQRSRRGDSDSTPQELLLRDEIRRVAHTLIRLMEITQT